MGETERVAQVVFVLGGPGSGKGTQCAKISDRFGLVHVSIGDLLRTIDKTSSPEAALVFEQMAAGILVSTALVMKLLRQEMNKHMDKGKFKFLIDGFPRNQENIDGWSQEFADGSAHINFVLFLECPESVMEQRLLERGKISGRVDDNIDAIKKRFKTFLENTAPVMTQYEAKGLLRVVDATRTVDDVFDSVCKVFLAHEEETKLVGTRKPEAIFVIGGPGAGKGTQCAKISKTFGYLHLSTGDLLREAVNKGDSEEEKLIQTYQAEGKLVPISIVMSQLKKAMESHVKRGTYSFLIDGFPRNQENIDGWNAAFGDGSVKLKFVLYFDCPEETMSARLLDRGKTSGRSDDNVDSIIKRFKTFQEATIPIIEYYKKNGLLCTISSIPPPETVFENVTKLFTRPKVTFVLGGPGAGKGTQCQKIVSEFPVVHLSAGDLLREEQKTASEHAKLISHYITEGKIVPVEITVSLIRKAMLRHLQEGRSVFLIDGFPRSFDNLEGWYRVIGREATVKFCLYIDVPEAVMEARLLDRGKSSGREDDNITSIKKRFKTYVESTMPVIEYFGKIGKLHKVNGELRPEQVYQSIQPLFAKIC